MYKARIEDWHGDGWEEQPNAPGPRDAAESCAERYIHQSANYNAIDGEPIAVSVLYPDGTEKVWNVQASTSIHYYARPAPNGEVTGRASAACEGPR